MMIPAIAHLISEKKYRDILTILLTPLFFPFWLAMKALFGEEKADALIPSIAQLDNLPSWVGGGDIRLGILLGLTVGPVYFWWIIGIGYTLGTLFWTLSRILR